MNVLCAVHAGDQGPGVSHRHAASVPGSEIPKKSTIYYSEVDTTLPILDRRVGTTFDESGSSVNIDGATTRAGGLQ